MPSNNHRVAFNEAKRAFAKQFGERVTVSNVDYTTQDQTPTTLYSKMYFLEPEGPQFAQAALPNGGYYCVHGDFNFVEPGYVLTPTETGSSTPVITILSKAFLGEIVGFRTNRIGAIYNGEELVYSGIRWDTCATSFTANFPIGKEFRASPDVPTLRVNMFTRDLRTSGMTGFDTEGLLFVETDKSPNVYWKIREAVTIGGITQLDLELSRYE